MAIGIALSVIIISITIAFFFLRKREVRGTTSLIIFSIALTVWACAAFSNTIVYRLGRFWLALVYLSATVTATALLTFILAYTNQQEWLGG